MLIQTDRGLAAGPYDALVILHDVAAGRFHPAVFREAPMPGGQEPTAQGFVRLKSLMHHTAGFTTLEEAQTYTASTLRDQVDILDANVWLEPRAWDGQPGVMLLEPLSAFGNGT